MPITVTARQREPLDLLVWRTTGGGPAAVEATLEANPGLAELGPNLPENTTVIIPEITPAPATIDLVQLWT